MNESFLTKLVVGAGSPLAGLVISLSTYNEWMQAASLTLGVMVGGITLINLVRNWFKK